MNLAFQHPLSLLLLPLALCFVICREHLRVYYITPLSWLGGQTRLVERELWLKLAIFTLSILSLSQPFFYESSEGGHKRGRDLFLVIDASGSMGEKGYDSSESSLSRFESAIALSKEFVSKRHDDNIGVVLFGTFAYTASPLSYDLAAVGSMLSLLDIGIAGENTALGDAIAEALRSLRESKAQSKAIILLTDGYHNSGRTSPKEALSKAVEMGVRIYTIGIGNEYDEALLRTIAEQSGAHSYRAADARELSSVYSEIDSLEPSPVRGEEYLGREELFVYPLAAAFILLFGWIAMERRARS